MYCRVIWHLKSAAVSTAFIPTTKPAFYIASRQHLAYLQPAITVMSITHFILPHKGKGHPITGHEGPEGE